MSFLQKYYYLFILFIGLTLLLPQGAFAQIKLTSHAEIDSKTRMVHVGTHSYETIDNQHVLSADNIHARYNSQDRGTLIGRKIFNFGLGAKPRWISFSVTNNSSQENWLLDFGSLFQGRLGQIAELEVRNYTRNEMYYSSAMPSPEHAGMDGSTLPVKITPGQTELFTIYLDSADRLPATYTLSLVQSDSWFSFAQLDKWGMAVLYGFLFLLTGFFVTFFILSKRLWYLLCSVFTLINLSLISFLDHVVIGNILLSDKVPAFLMSGIMIVAILILRTFYDVKKQDRFITSVFSILIGLVTITLSLSFIPGTLLERFSIKGLEFLQPSVHFISLLFCGLCVFALTLRLRSTVWDVAYPFVTSCALFFVGMMGSAVGLLLFKGNDAFALNLYFLSLLPGGLFLASAALKDYRAQDQDRLSAVTRKSRADQALSRLQQQKEADDQARLMRVIERERELMSELRENEARQTEEMRRAKDEADAANLAKSAFLAVVSHEIRTPMNGIMGILRLVQDTPMDEEQSNYMLTMQKTGETMTALLNDILDFEKIETGSMDLEHINMDLHGTVQGIVMLMSGYIGDKDVALKSDIGPNVPRYVLGDPTRLRQVLLNLVSNAIKFTESGSVILQLRAQKLDTLPAGIKGDYEIAFSVIDTGAGISEDAQVNLFKPFQQADSSIARQYGGSGLGLAISMRLVEIMGSAIHLDSTLGKGSRFSFSLLVEEGYGDDGDIIPLAADEPVRLAKPLRVLVVEDNEVNRRVLQSMLEKDQHTVLLAASGEAGLQVLEEETVDIVFMDINMPGISGLEMAAAIRKMPQHDGLMLVAITGNVMQDDLARIKQASIDDVVSKPVDFSHVQQILLGVSDRVNTGDVIVQDNVHAETEENTAEEPPPESTSEDSNESILYDTPALQSLLDTLGADVFNELVFDCLDKVDEIVGLVTEPEHRKDVDFIYERMHELKGMAYNFGLTGIGDIARDGEAAAKDKNLDSALQAADQLSSAKGASRVEIEAWVKAQT